MHARFALAGLLSTLLVHPASAQDPAEPEAFGRVLAGHTFMPSTLVPGALVTTSFGSNFLLGFGTSSTSFEVGGRLYEGSFTYAGLGTSLGYEYAFSPHFSARFELSEAMYSGIDGPSVITVGTTIQTSGALGATASLPVGDTLRLAARLDVGIAPGLALTIGNGIKSAIEKCQAGDCTFESTGEAVEVDNAKTVQPALAASWVPWRPLGVTANVAYLFVDTKLNGEPLQAHAISLAGAADLDLRELAGVPIGLQLVVNWSAPISGDGLQHVTDLGWGVFYTGREHLALGLQVVHRRFAVQESLPVNWTTTLATIGLRYYW